MQRLTFGYIGKEIRNKGDIIQKLKILRFQNFKACLKNAK